MAMRNCVLRPPNAKRIPAVADDSNTNGQAASTFLPHPPQPYGTLIAYPTFIPPSSDYRFRDPSLLYITCKSTKFNQSRDGPPKVVTISSTPPLVLGESVTNHDAPPLFSPTSCYPPVLIDSLGGHNGASRFKLENAQIIVEIPHRKNRQAVEEHGFARSLHEPVYDATDARRSLSARRSPCRSIFPIAIPPETLEKHLIGERHQTTVVFTYFPRRQFKVMDRFFCGTSSIHNRVRYGVP